MSNAHTDDLRHLESLNATLDRMRKFVNLTQPYIQSIPQDEPRYHHYNQHFANMWLRDTPFDAREDPTHQYQTWFFREHGSDTIHLRSHTASDSLSQPVPSVDSPRAMTATADTPPAHVHTPCAHVQSAPNKKISLAAYKKNVSCQDNSLPTSADRAIEQTSSQSAISADRAIQRSSTQLATSADRATTQPSSQPATSATARVNPDSTRSPPSQTQKRKRTPEDTSLPGGTYKDSIKRQRSLSPVERDHDRVRVPLLPQKLSPLHMPSTDVSRSHGDLPPRLSPLHLPTAFTATKRDSDMGSALPIPMDGSTSPKISSVDHVADNIDHGRRPLDLPEKLSPLLSPLLVPLSPTLPDAITRALENRDAERAKGSTKADNVRNDNRIANKAPVAISSGNHSLRDDSTVIGEATPSLLVKLKIPRRLRQDVKRLLQLSPRPKLSRTYSTTSVDEPARDNRPAKDQGMFRSSSDSQPKKPPASSVLASMVGSGRLLSSDKAGATRATSHQRSTPPSAQHASPAKISSHFSSSLNRGDRALGSSNDGAAHAATPASPAMSVLSQTIRPSPKIGTSSATTSTKTPESQAWWLERERYMDLAKQLKKRHASEYQSRSAALASKSSYPSAGDRDAELAVLTNIESFTAFMLSFHCQDMSYASRNPSINNVNARETWCSLHGFWVFIFGSCASLPKLEELGQLVCALGMVYNARILQSLTSGHDASGSASGAASGNVAGGGHGQLRRGGPEEREAVNMLSKIISAPAAVTTDGGGASTGDVQAKSKAISGGIGLQTSVLEATQKVVEFLDDYTCVHGGSFKSRLGRAMAESSLLTSSST